MIHSGNIKEETKAKELNNTQAKETKPELETRLD